MYNLLNLPISPADVHPTRIVAVYVPLAAFASLESIDNDAILATGRFVTVDVPVRDDK